MASADNTTMAIPDNSTMATIDNPIMATADNPALVTSGDTTAATDEGECSTGKAKGKRKIQMQKIESNTYLQVTFSKRRAGLFKKASEICTLCGVQMAIIAFSPGQKAFSFGHPSVETILNRYLAEAPLPESESLTEDMVHVCKDVNISELSEELAKLEAVLAKEKDRGALLESMRSAVHSSDNWWENPVGEMNMKELEEMKNILKWLKNQAITELQKYLDQGSSNLNFVPYPGAFPYHHPVHNNIWIGSCFGAGIPFVDQVSNYVPDVAAPTPNRDRNDSRNGIGRLS